MAERQSMNSDTRIKFIQGEVYFFKFIIYFFNEFYWWLQLNSEYYKKSIDKLNTMRNIIFVRLCTTIICFWATILIAKSQVQQIISNGLIKTGKLDLVSLKPFLKQNAKVQYDAPYSNKPDSMYKNVALAISELVYHSEDSKIHYQIKSYQPNEIGFSFQAFYESNSSFIFIRIQYLAADHAIPDSFMSIQQAKHNQNFQLNEYARFMQQEPLKYKENNQQNSYQFLIFNNYLEAHLTMQKIFSFKFSQSSSNRGLFSIQKIIPKNMVVKNWGYQLIYINKTNMRNIGCEVLIREYKISNDPNSISNIQLFVSGNQFFGLSLFSLKTGSMQVFLENSLKFSRRSFILKDFLMFNYAYLVEKSCPQSHPFSKRTQHGQLCYQQCGSGYFAQKSIDQLNWRCESCNQTCLQCTSFNICTKCSDANNRNLNGQRCIAKPGFYQSGKSYAISCPQNCLFCQSPSSCLICQIGFAVSNENATCIHSQQMIVSRLLDDDDPVCISGQYPQSGDCQLCNQTLSQCIQCNDGATCTLCKSPTFVMPNYRCGPCSLAIANCIACVSGPTACAICASGFALESATGGCIAITCPNYCLSCSSSSNCITCQSQSYISAGMCQLCSNNMTGCAQCQQTLGCTLCSDQYLLISGICELCSDHISNCLTCLDLSTCDACLRGFILMNSVCIAAPCAVSNCAVCDQTNQNICVQCVLGYELGQSPDCYLINCQAQCQICQDYSSCHTCLTGYYLLPNKTCSPCSNIPNCQQCSNLGCTFCDSQFYPDSQDVGCLPCSVAFCIQCLTNQNLCAVCDSTTGYFLNASTSLCDYFTCNVVNCDNCQPANPFSCQNCLVGYQVSASSQCQLIQCTSPCLMCSSLLASSPCLSCLPGFYLDQFNQCILCSLGCSQCTDQNTCNNCIVGFYLSSANTCALCSTGCISCNSLTICDECQSSFYLSNTNQCVSCQNYDVNCIRCDQSICLTCNSGYQVSSANPMQCQVIPCVVKDCITCVQNNINACSFCSLGFQVDSQGLCRTRCGDGICIITQEECDDGNLDKMDGCSEQCKQEVGFKCDLPVPPAIPLSDCTYTQSIDFNISYLQKVQGANKVNAKMSISPLLKAFQSFDFRSLISTDLPVSEYAFEYDAQSGVLNMVLTYEESIEGIQATVTINPPQMGVFRLTPSSSTRIVMNSRDNSGLYIYTEQTYDLAAIIAAISIVLPVLAWIFFIIGLFAGKMVAVEMFAVFQIASFGLIVVKDMNPTLNALKNLFISNGFNKFAIIDAYSLSEVPQQLKGLGLDHQFMNNFNISLLFVSIPLLIGLTTFVLSKTIFKDNKQKIQLMNKICTSSIGEYTFTMIVLSGYLIAVAAAMQFAYGFNKLEGALGYLSIPQSLVMIMAVIIYFVLLILKAGIFGQFKAQFDPSSKLSYYTYNYMLIQRMLVGVLLTVLYFFPYSLLFPIFIFLVEGIFFVIKKPYNKIRHSYRMMVNNLIAIIVLSIYLYFAIDPSNSSISDVGIYLPIVVILLLLVCLILNAAFIINCFVKMIKRQCRRQKNQKSVDLQLTNVKPLISDCGQLSHDFKPSPLTKLRQQNNGAIIGLVQKLPDRESKDDLKQIQMGFDMTEIIAQEFSSTLHSKLQQKQKNIQNALGTIKQAKKRILEVIEPQELQKDINLMQYEEDL